jgi:hypothetical protein
MYAMFTEAGNKAVERMVRRLVQLPSHLSDQEWFAIYRGELSRVAKRYPEVKDTASIESIAVDLVKLTGRNYWGVAP